MKYNCTLDKLSSRSYASGPYSCLERVKSLFNHTVRSLHYVPPFLVRLIKPRLSTLDIPSKRGIMPSQSLKGQAESPKMTGSMFFKCIPQTAFFQNS